MDQGTALPQQEQMDEFRRRHRTGLVTLMFTDIVGSTALKQRLGDRASVDLFRVHDELIRQTLRQFPQGEEINTAGDSFLLVFATPSDAVEFALLTKEKLRQLRRSNAESVLDRVGIHVGEVLVSQEQENRKPRDLFGIQIDTCSRVMSLAQAGHVLMTRAAFDSARQALKGEDIPGVGPLEWLNHGPYVLKGLEDPVEICEVREVGYPAQGPPADSEKAHRKVSADEEPVLGWRPALEQSVPGTKWTLERKLGEGGFGEVWLGRHETLKEKRVFKFCFRADRVRALKREVTLFRVMKEKIGQHPNIVGIQEVFFDRPPYYIVMDYAEGQDLRAWCEAQGGPDKVALATRLEMVAQAADALQAAHEAGVIHRDVKPSNILISQPSTFNSQLTVKLTDFGIGQVVSQEALAGMTRMGFTQTMIGPGSTSHTGTQLYMAPELLAGQPASISSDIYSLGVVMYQLLIGDFSRPLTTDWARRIDDPLLRKDLERCFAGDPQERFASVRELAQSIRSLGTRRVEALTLQRATQRRKLTIRVMATIALLVLLSAGAFVVFRQRTVLGGTRNLDAMYRYELGKAASLDRKDGERLKAAVTNFDEAITYDPKYALAYVGKAVACRSLENVFEPGKGWDKKAFEAADKAIGLCPRLAEAYYARGLLWFTPLKRWDFQSEVKDLRYALSLNRRVKNAHFNLAFVFEHLGLLEAAMDELEQELALYPEDRTPRQLEGLVLINLGRYKEAIDVLRKTPDEAYPHLRSKGWLMALAYFYSGDTPHAAALLEEMLARKDLADDPLLYSVQAILYAASNNVTAAEERIERAKRSDRNFVHYHHITYNIGSAYALLGRNTEAIPWLKMAAEDGFPCYELFKIDPNLQKLRGDPAFKALMQELLRQYEDNRATLKIVNRH
jgi:serine/threonine protein kinase/class 3 adenylate cyclase